MTTAEASARLRAAVASDVLSAPVRFSNLKHIAKSPRHYRHGLLNPLEQSRAMRIGSAVHYRLLGGERPYQVYRGRRQGKDWDDFERQYFDQTILNQGEEDDVLEIAEAVRNDEFARPFFTGGQYEQRIDWQWGRRKCSSGLDIIQPGVLAELKVSHTADPERFWRHCTNQLWHAQLAFYRHALHRSAGVTESLGLSVYIIAVEPKPPYVVTVFKLSDAMLEQGDALCMSWMERLAQCEADDYWPGYAERIVPLDKPNWDGVMADDEDGIGEEGDMAF